MYDVENNNENKELQVIAEMLLGHKNYSVQIVYSINNTGHIMLKMFLHMHNGYLYGFSIFMEEVLAQIFQSFFRKLTFKNITAIPVVFMLNKNTWGVKKCEANQKQHSKQADATKRFDISRGQEVTLSNIF